MGKDSKITWTTHTFNPWVGCAHVSEGCRNCYAERLMDARLGKAKWGMNGTRVRTSESNWYQPIKWDAEAAKNGTRPKVFCASLADVFENRDKDLTRWRHILWKLINATPNLTWMLLTKRPENIANFFPALWIHGSWPSHVWMGVSAANQEEADKNIPILLSIPAPVRFVSAEPLIGPISFDYPDTVCQCGEYVENHNRFSDHGAVPMIASYLHEGVNYVIAGGESGPNARPMHPQWVRDIRDQCVEAKVKFHLKQWGEWLPRDEILCQPFGTDFDSNELVELIENTAMVRVGKKRAGRLLDGVEWNEEPK